MKKISDNARQAYGLLRNKGYSHVHSAALVGNMMQESGWKINTGAVGDGGNAFGAVQWNGPRRRAFLSYAQQRGANPKDLSVQVDYLDHELRTSERGAAKRILAASDLNQATVLASQKFWRPGDPRNKNRMRYAQAVASQVGGGFSGGAGSDQLQGGSLDDLIDAQYGASSSGNAGSLDDLIDQQYEQSAPSGPTPGDPTKAQPTPAMPEGMVEMPSGYVVDTNAAAEQAVRSGAVDGSGLAGASLQGIPFIGEYFDEIMGFVDEQLGGVPGLKGALADALQRKWAEANPNQALGGQLVMGAATAAPAALVAAPYIGAVAPTSIGGKMLAGITAGAVAGATEGAVSGYGAGQGDDRLSSAADRAKTGAMVGAGVGAAIPVVGAGVGAVADRLLTGNAKRVARQQNVSPDTASVVGQMVRNDGGADAVRNLDAPDAMIADAGPSTSGLLDASIQKAGPGGRVAREAIDQRVTLASDDINAALNDAFGRPRPSRRGRNARQAQRLNRLYETAYRKAIDYSGAAGREIEELLRRVPRSALRRADELMDLEGVASRQRLVQIGPNGEEIVSTMPDVRQIDYITRALGDDAAAADGQGALGGTTNKGRLLTRLAREMRGALREAVPEWATAVNRAATEISAKKARELGETALRTSVSRGELSEAIEDMGSAELQQLRRGVRSFIDDTISNVKRTLTDDNVTAREGLSALKMLSSRAALQKIRMIIGDGPAAGLQRRMENASRAFEARARTADNSRTFARQSMDQAIRDITEPGAVGKILQGAPLDSGRRIIQGLTGMTPQARQQAEQRLAGEIAGFLTAERGDGARRAMLQLVRALETDEMGANLAQLLSQRASALTAASGSQASTQLQMQ